MTELKRELGLFDATMINVGTMIGTSIFLVPAAIAALVPGSALITLVWVVGGAVSLLGALAVAELSAAYPEAGGQYAYLREAYGPVWGYLYGWSTFAVINTAAIAAIAVGFATYLGYFVPLGPAAVKIVAMLSIAALTTINCLGVRLGVITQNVLTTFKMAALATLVVFGTRGAIANLAPAWTGTSPAEWLAPFGLAMLLVLFAYDGWIESTYIGGEVRNPGRNLPLSIILSTAIVIVLYTLVSVAFMLVLSPAGMAASPLAASDAARLTVGASGATFVTLAILVSALGANNGIVLTAARVPYAMARGGLFFAWAGTVHPRLGTPVAALVAQGVVASALTLAGAYDRLALYVVFASWIFYAMSCAAVIRLRHTAPQLPRPYRTWGYPVTPVVFIAFALWLVYNTVREKPLDAAVGVGLILLGLPGYFYWRRRPAGDRAARNAA